MKISPVSSNLGWCWLCAILSAGLLMARRADAARGSTAHTPDFLQSFGSINRRDLQDVVSLQKTSSNKDSGGGATSGDGSGSTSTCKEGKCPEDYADLLSDQCYICTPWDENKVRPPSITALYIGGTGAISRYQSEDKTTCRDQVYPLSGTMTLSGEEGGSGTSYPVTDGAVIVMLPPDGDEFGANTYFAFDNGVSCYIHTSCSQPLVAGDQLGPFLLLEANDCSYAYCGDGVLNGNETCDGTTLIPTCRADCTYCGDGTVNGDEACDEGADSDTCVACAIPDIVPECGNGILEEGETCDIGAENGGDDNVCRDDCTYCGDGTTDTTTGEECDEGDAMPSDTCVNCKQPSCGDGELNGDEACDDGANGDDTDGCRDDCTIPVCSDGIVDTDLGEECDEGEAMPSDTCINCKKPPCGDGEMNGDEECDDGANGNDADGCRDDCTVPVCSDGIVDTDMGEECDEGEAMPSDTCVNCKKPSCGDGEVNGDEECDDGANGNDADGCRDDCTVPVCADGIVDTDLGEECDEGDAMPSDTCVDCKTPSCGDGTVNGDEACDDGANGIDADGCRDDCTVPVCADGIVDADLGEECDEGEAMPSDTCVNCKKPSCGDGIVNMGEECDGGVNGNDSDGCRDDCTVPVCADGIVDTALGEECDEGEAMPSDTCVNCMKPSCGDGTVNMGEECDDGANGDDADGCRDDCTIPVCADGIVDTSMGEECDEGDAMPSDTCVNCKTPSCGDGELNGDEECDDGANGNDADGCRDDCTVPFCGDGIVDANLGEECDMGADNGQMTGSGACKADCTLCVCGAEATYNSNTGGVTIEFDMCGAEPLESDFIGIYPCNETTKVADQDWWDNKVCKQFPAACGDFQFGYEENKTYVGNLYKWFSWTCGSPQDGGCQTKGTTVWPDSGTVVLDPNKNGTNWAFLGGRTLEPGCYKAILQREMYFISPPPYPDICPEGWEGALEFTVPASSGTEVSPLEQSAQSGSRSILSIFFVFLVSTMALYFLSK